MEKTKEKRVAVRGFSDRLRKMECWATFLLCLSAACLVSCSSDDDESGGGGQVANEMPLVSNAGIKFPVTKITSSEDDEVDVLNAFTYKDGRMTSSFSSDYEDGIFTYASNPLSVKISYEDELVDIFKDIRVNGRGFITSCEAIYDNFTVEYDSEDHIVSVKHTYKYPGSGEEDEESGTITLTNTWVDGNLVKQTVEEDDSEDWRHSYVIEWTYDENLYPNPGIFDFTDGEFGLITDYILPKALHYAGLLGKTTKNIPASIKETWSEPDVYFRNDECRINSVDYNSDSSVSRINLTWNGSYPSFISFDYGTDWKDNYGPLLRNYSHLVKSSAVGGRPMRKGSLRQRTMERIAK